MNKAQAYRWPTDDRGVKTCFFHDQLACWQITFSLSF